MVDRDEFWKGNSGFIAGKDDIDGAKLIEMGLEVADEVIDPCLRLIHDFSRKHKDHNKELSTILTSLFLTMVQSITPHPTEFLVVCAHQSLKARASTEEEYRIKKATFEAMNKDE